MTDQIEDAEMVQQELNAQAQQPVSLSLQDIATFVQIIDTASRRGAFEGREMAGIGTLRNKTEMFLRQASEQQGQQPPQGAMPPQAPADVPEGPMADKVVAN